MKELTFLLIAYGITNILVFGSIFDGLRSTLNGFSPKILGKLITCPLCLSMWVGMLLSGLFTYLDYKTPMDIYSAVMFVPVKIFLDGCFTSGGVWLIHTIQEYFEKNTIKH